MEHLEVGERAADTDLSLASELNGNDSNERVASIRPVAANIPELVPADLAMRRDPIPVNSIAVKLRVEVGDSVRYCFLDDSNEEAFVTIVEYASNPNLGMINVDTVVARALLGLEVGQESEVSLAAGRRKIRVVQLHKHAARRSLWPGGAKD